MGAQGGHRRNAPSGEGEPVEQAFGHDGKGRSGAETPESQHRLGAGKGLDPGPQLRAQAQAPAREPSDEAAGDVGDDDHAGESLPAPLHEQPRVPDALLREAAGLEGPPQPAARRVAEAQAGCGGRAHAPGGQVLPPLGAAVQLPGVEPGGLRQQGGVAGRQSGGLGTPRSG